MRSKIHFAVIGALLISCSAYADGMTDKFVDDAKIVAGSGKKKVDSDSLAAKAKQQDPSRSRFDNQSAQAVPLPALDLAINKAQENPFQDTKQVVYNYDPNQSYPVVTRPGLYTQIDIPEGLIVNGFYLSDSSEESWTFHVSADKKHIFVKSLRGGMFNSGSILAGDQSYLLAFSSADTGEWFQRVKWILPARFKPKTVEEKSLLSSLTDGKPAKSNGIFEDYKKPESEQPTYRGVNADSLNTNWRIEGEAPFKPSQVYNDDKFTWIIMPASVDELPALFALAPNGDTELVNYTIGKDSKIKVNRVLPGAMLKLGKMEIKLYNTEAWKKYSGYPSGPATSTFSLPWSK